MDQITEDLYLTDFSSAQSANPTSLDHIISVCQISIAPVDCQYDHFPLADGPHDTYRDGTCSYDLFETAADCLLTSLKGGNKTLIHCFEGKSRSIAVSAAALNVFRQTSYGTEIDRLSSKRSVDIAVNDTLKQYAKSYPHSPE
jgi:protein-tyrosine phosphatase